ncbi:MAG: DUF1254 domain-containing protein [Alphaproteobacteria bacterium]|nr:DUF1254 domain-containing protein [Alphaproteobacteria bacterium]
MRSWALRIAYVLALAAATHWLALWLLPQVIMHQLIERLGQEIGLNRPARPPLPDHTSRRVVMPSPDLLYVICAFDLAKGPLTVEAVPQSEAARLPYWSVAFYADNSDNFFVLNDREAGARPIRLMLTDGPVAAPEGARAVVSPTRRGVVLFRVLVADGENREAAEAARRGMSCRPA